MTAQPTAQHVGPTTTRALHIFPQIAARRSTAGILVLVRATPMAWAWPGDSCAILHKHNIHCIWACEVAMLHMGQEPAPLATNDLGSVRHATACMQADQAQVITKSARSPTSSQSTPPAPFLRYHHESRFITAPSISHLRLSRNVPRRNTRTARPPSPPQTVGFPTQDDADRQEQQHHRRPNEAHAHDVVRRRRNRNLATKDAHLRRCHRCQCLQHCGFSATNELECVLLA